MPFHVGDLVRIDNGNVLRPPIARVQQVLPQTLSVPDFQEYVVEFVDFCSERFRFGLCREFEMRLDTQLMTLMRSEYESIRCWGKSPSYFDHSVVLGSCWTDRANS